MLPVTEMLSGHFKRLVRELCMKCENNAELICKRFCAHMIMAEPETVKNYEEAV
jgi:hypothetical protein